MKESSCSYRFIIRTVILREREFFSTRAYRSFELQNQSEVSPVAAELIMSEIYTSYS